MNREYVKRRMKLAAMDVEEDLDRLHPMKEEVRRSTCNGKETRTVLRYRTKDERKTLLKASELIEKADRTGRIHSRGNLTVGG